MQPDRYAEPPQDSRHGVDSDRYMDIGSSIFHPLECGRRAGLPHDVARLDCVFESRRRPRTLWLSVIGIEVPRDTRLFPLMRGWDSPRNLRLGFYIYLQKIFGIFGAVAIQDTVERPGFQYLARHDDCSTRHRVIEMRQRNLHDRCATCFQSPQSRPHRSHFATIPCLKFFGTAPQTANVAIPFLGLVGNVTARGRCIQCLS